LTASVNFCPHCGTSTSDAVESPPAEPVSERRVVSVLFGDLVGFTPLSESRDAEEVRELLSRYFDTARGIVARYGGTIEKFIGDAVMAVWGVPSTHEDDAERAVRAGIDLADAVAAFGDSVGAPGLTMRVGVVTGEVAVSIGATGQGMVAGDAVNTAARVQAEAAPGAVWVDNQTRALVGGSIEFRAAGVHELKGKSAPIELFTATAVMGGVGGERASDRIHGPLVGRRHELSVLKESFHVAADEGRPRLAILSGDAGLGKSRLGRELDNYIDGLSAPVLWHFGRCLAYGDGVAFSALTAAVRGRIGASDGDTDTTVQEKLVRSLETYVADAAEWTRLLAALTNLLGLTGATGLLTRADLFSAWLRWFERLSQLNGEPIVWMIDDAQYADDGLLDFIELLATVAQVPLLIVMLTRPELLARRPALATLRRTTVVGIERLSGADIAGLLDELVDGIPADVRDVLVARAEGNPLFAIETVRAMYDQGLAVDGPTRRAGAVRLAPGVDATTLSAFAAPTSLQLLVASRLDLLPARERSLLATAAVIGQTVSRDALQAVSGVSEADLSAALRELIGRDLLTTVTDPLSADEGRYAFVQTVVRTVAYQTQSKRDRLQRHLAVVDYLESLSDRDTELNTVIAQHVSDAMSLVGLDEPQSAELAARLVRWLERSAERSVAVGAPSDGARALAEALPFAVDSRDQVRLRLAAAGAALAAGDLDESVAHAREVLSGDLHASGLEVARAATTAATALRLSGQYEEGWTFIEPYLRAGALDGLPSGIAAPLARQLGSYLYSLGRHDEAMIWLDRALGLAEDTMDPREIAQSLNACAVAYLRRGRARVGVALLGLCADTARTNGLVFELAMPLMNMAAVGINRDPMAAVSAGEQAMALFEQAGSVSQYRDTAMNLALLLTITGRWEELDALRDRPLLRDARLVPYQSAILELSLAVVGLARDEAVNVAALDELASLCEASRLESADDVYFAADRVAFARATRDRTSIVDAARRLVEIATRNDALDDDLPTLWSLGVGWTIDAGDLDAAHELLRPVSEAPPGRLNPLLTAELARLRATVEVADPASTADPADIERTLLESIGALNELGAVPDRARAQATLGRWLTDRGRSTDAKAHLDAARATFSDLRAHAWLRELEPELALSRATTPV
jgi:class 3 adenylate cyclase/tetratricopeptide (TPR) repeat protein